MPSFLAPPRTVIGLGANLGDRWATLESAAAAVAALPAVKLLGRSSVWQTAPVAPPGTPPQPDFYNSALVVRTALPPEELLAALLAVEQRFGRVRSTPNAPRTLDLDILWIEGVALDGPSLMVPHPRLHERAFALAPLVEVAGDAVDPRTLASYASILHRVGLTGVKKLAGPLDSPLA